MIFVLLGVHVHPFLKFEMVLRPSKYNTCLVHNIVRLKIINSHRDDPHIYNNQCFLKRSYCIQKDVWMITDLLDCMYLCGISALFCIYSKQQVSDYAQHHSHISNKIISHSIIASFRAH